MLLVLLTTYSCSTKKNTFTRRVYHNLTGHYNMYWNGRESYREGVMQLKKTVKDNYNKILPVYNYGTEQEAQALNPYMDKAIEKASLNVEEHSMFFNRREYVNWIDDSYLLIGQAYFYKQDYNKARRTFEFVANEYKYNDIKFTALLWLAKSYNQLGQYKRAQSVLDNLQNEIDKTPKAPEKVIMELPLVRAQMFLLQEKYSQAKDPLRDALFLRQKRLMDARTRFILAQIYQKEEEYYRASEYYREVIKRNPPYEMAFNAAINLAQSYDSRYGESSKDIVKNLQKMLKEDKNIEYQDQIYYALADISFKDSLDSLAINYLRLSVAKSVSNDYQKAKSALKLGDIYFQVPEYQLAQAYYDTAVQVLPEDYPNKEGIELRTTYLTELVENIIVVIEQDSLQKLASMNEDERNAIIDKLIEDVIEKEKLQKEKEELMALQQLAGNNASQSTSFASGPGQGSWYFYNPAAMSNGLSEFKKKWGNRKLEDNWRLSNKKTVFDETEEQLALNADSTYTDSTGAVITVTSNDPHTREYYLQNVPLTEPQLEASNKQIEQALFNLGFIYKDKLNNYNKSIESFESLNTRFPDHENLLQSYYQLYRNFVILENQEQADYYKNLIIDQFPDSDYARILLDPEYYKELEAQKNLALTLYRETYDHYEAGHFYTVYSNSTRAITEFEKPEELLARFEYLRALSLGKIEVVDSLQAALEQLVVKYPNSEVTPLAQNILDYLKGPIDSTGTVAEPEEVIDVSIYSFNPRSKQIFALVASGPGVNINALKIRISDFNKKYFSIENISITNLLIDKTTHLVMVGNFNTVDDAMRYYDAIMSNDYVFANMETEEYDGFVITQENYPILYKDKDLKKYLAFFRQNYLKD
ncbi:MAG: tetratricopeptide repeat protein [Bacteroidetes bacterium]|nr:tetratricopeptide repeat protein [Bacteroidota bacterium]